MAVLVLGMAGARSRMAGGGWQAAAQGGEWQGRDGAGAAGSGAMYSTEIGNGSTRRLP